MRTVEVIHNLKNYSGWDYKHYPMPKQEAEVCLEALENVPKWIPITGDEEGIVNCPLPEDGQIIIISRGNYVTVDECVHETDEDGNHIYYLDSGDEFGLGDAWMPLPRAWDGRKE